VGAVAGWSLEDDAAEPLRFEHAVAAAINANPIRPAISQVTEGSSAYVMPRARCGERVWCGAVRGVVPDAYSEARQMSLVKR